MAEIKVSNVTKTYNEGEVVAVDNLNVSFPDAKVTSLLGPSGSGKTTTMRLIAGLEEVTEGKIYFGEKDVTSLEGKDRNIAMVFQFPALYENLDLFGNISAPIQDEFSSSEVNSRVEKYADLLGLSNLHDRYPDEIGAAERQRVAIAKAVVRKPEAFLFDEPIAHLAPSVRPRLKRLIRELAHELGTTFIYVTHDQSEALTLSDTVAIMKEGSVVQFGQAEEIYENPKSEFVGWFLGKPGMNFVDGVYNGKKGEIKFGSSTFNIDSSKVESLEGRKKDVRIGFRPEHVVVKSMGSSSEEDGTWKKAKCSVVQPLGGRDVLHLQDGESTFASKEEPKGITGGSDVYYKLKPENLRVFDSGSKELLSGN